MLPLRLIRRNLLKHGIRSTLTVASIAIAMFLLCVLRSLVVSLDAGIRDARVDRLIVQSSVSLFVYLPQSYGPKLREIEGVEEIVRWNWFGGHYRDPKNFFAQFATDAKQLLAVYPELELIEGSREKFESDRRACIIGQDTARKYGFEVGQTIPIIGALFPRLDKAPWEFTVAGIYRSTKASVDNATLYFHYDYLEKALEAGESGGPRGVGLFVMKLAPGADPTAVMSETDALFENGPQRVQTTTEAEFQAQFVSMVGNVPFFIASIGTGVMIAILLAALNTMLMAAREQTRDVGVLKALGFQDGTVFGVMLLQSLFLCGSGGILGLTLAKMLEPFMQRMLGTMFPAYAVTTDVLLLGLALTIAIGIFAGIAPAIAARRLNAVSALRSTA